MNAVQEGDHLQEIGQRLEQVVVLLVRQIALNIEVADEDQAGKGQHLLLAPAELGILHVALHDADERLGVGEIGVGDLVKDHRIAGAHLADLAGVEVDEELRRRRLAA